MACYGFSPYFSITGKLLLLLVVMNPLVVVARGKQQQDSGFGSFSKYFSALGSDLGNMVNTIASTVETFDKIASTVENLDFSGSNDCVYKCPYGRTAIPNTAYKPTVNGCGSFGVEISLHDLPQLTQCCNAHDLCYDKCGESKYMCDRELQRCAQNVCMMKASKYQTELLAKEACNALGEMLYRTTSMLGCEPYKGAQQKACTCVNVDYRNEL